MANGNVCLILSFCLLIPSSIDAHAAKADEPLRTLFTNSKADIETHPNMPLLNLRNCGKLSDNRISNGDKANLREFPWMALLNYHIDGVTAKNTFLCGGSLINENYVMSAAHCVKLPYKLISVRLGEHNIKTDIDCVMMEDEVSCTEPVQDIPVKSFVYHRNYNKPRFANDIALIRLEKPADLSTESVQPICLPVTEKIRNKALGTLFVTGWGTTETGLTSDVLLKATVKAVSRDVCQKDFKEVFIQEEQFCATNNNASNSCQGDSGGPLQFPDVFNPKFGPRYIQYGVVSFGIEGCGKNKYASAVYCRVSSYMNWILDNLNP